uniref:Uncharacterized protein n=1 Tax=Anguilla anguilla TaxID=7936 RepID=A0A0E9WJR8_ANGAN
MKKELGLIIHLKNNNTVRCSISFDASRKDIIDAMKSLCEENEMDVLFAPTMKERPWEIVFIAM